jgi:hypothetical protein
MYLLVGILELFLVEKPKWKFWNTYSVETVLEKLVQTCVYVNKKFLECLQVIRTTS